jgi:5-methylcytosine-specific restriction endonuclease McrA
LVVSHLGTNPLGLNIANISALTYWVEAIRKLDKDRRKTPERSYGHRWRVARAVFLHQPENALCRYCASSGRITEAMVVDHIEPHDTRELNIL